MEAHITPLAEGDELVLIRDSLYGILGGMLVFSAISTLIVRLGAPGWGWGPAGMLGAFAGLWAGLIFGSAAGIAVYQQQRDRQRDRQRRATR